MDRVENLKIATNFKAGPHLGEYIDVQILSLANLLHLEGKGAYKSGQILCSGIVAYYAAEYPREST